VIFCCFFPDTEAMGECDIEDVENKPHVLERVVGSPRLTSDNASDLPTGNDQDWDSYQVCVIIIVCFK